MNVLLNRNVHRYLIESDGFGDKMWQCVVVRHSFYRCTSCRQSHVRNLSDDCHSNQFRRFSSRLIERPNGMSYYTLSAILRIFDKKVAKSKRCTPSRPQPKREGIIAASVVQRSWKSALANTLFVSAANSSFFFFSWSIVVLVEDIKWWAGRGYLSDRRKK